MSSLLNILTIGDIIGRAGRRVLSQHLPRLIDQYAIDFVVANGENLASGFGMTEKTVDEMFRLGINVLTNGNHCWDKRDIIPRMQRDERLIRPYNFTRHAPGHGWTIVETPAGYRIAVLNLIGQVFMAGWDCPFEAASIAMQEIEQEPDIAAILVDVHAEASSEKMGIAWHLDGRASFVYGTHTHIPTCDELIHPSGTAYQTDLGMTGSYQSIIGMKIESSLKRMITRMPQRFEAVERGASLFATKVSIDPNTRKAVAIERIRIGPND